MKFKDLNKFFTLFLGLGLVLGGLVTGCASGESGGSTQTGTVALLLTDGPTEEFSQVNVTVNEISLLSEGREPVIIFSGARRINLLALQEVEDLFMIHDSVPVGIYNKIRLHVSDPEFVGIDGTVIPSTDIHLVANGKIDLLPDEHFEVSPGGTLVVLLDLDANKSIMIHPTSSGKYQFRPVVFVKVLDRIYTRLVSVNGVIESINTEDHSFLLRRSHPLFHDLDDDSVSDNASSSDDDDRPHLIRVVVSDETRIFEANGQPGDFDSLAVGQPIHVRGLLSAEDGLHIQARLIEIGEQFIRLHGSITQDIDSDLRFKFLPDPGQGIIGEIEVLVHSETLIFEACTHRLLAPDELVAGKRILIEGVLDLVAEPDLLHAAVIVVKPPELDLVRIEGTLFDPDPIHRTFLFSQNCPPELGCPTVLLQVHVMPDAVIIRINREDDHLGIELVPFDSLSNGDEVNLFGQFDESGSPFHARVVVVEGNSLSNP